MASVPIHNETDYTLTDDMTQQIIRDAQEHFGEEVRSIRVQAGIARHWSRSPLPLRLLSPPGMQHQRQRSSQHPSRTLRRIRRMRRT